MNLVIGIRSVKIVGNMSVINVILFMRDIADHIQDTLI